jgi:regulatory NSL complex subunit 3
MVVVIPPLPRLTAQSTRVQRFYTLFATMSPILPIQLQMNHLMAQKQSLQSIAEQIVSITRSKIQELKTENPDRRLILIGMHSSSSLALQVALVEQVSGVACFGFSFNTVHGPRGQPDDHILNLNTPALFMIGQNAARTSEEEVENFREKLTAPSTIVTVGCSDDFLRVSKKKRQLEGVTQEMVDNMIVDEIAEFAAKCIQRPLPTRPKTFTMIGNVSIHRQIDSSTGQARKRKTSQNMDGEMKTPKLKPTKIMRPTSTTSYVNPNDAIEMAVQSILPDSETKIKGARISSGVSQRLKIIPPTGKQPPQTHQAQKFYTIDGSRALQKSIIAVNQRPGNARPSTSIPSSPQIQYIANTSARLAAPLGKLPVQQQQNNFSPPKFTILRQVTTTNESGEVGGANIFDLPIVYADSEGNIEDDAAAASDGSVIEIPSDSSTSSTSTKKVLLKAANIAPYVSTAPTTVTITKNKNILIQKPQHPQTASKMLVLNGSVIGRSVPASNIVIPKTTTTMTSISQQQPQMRIQKIITTEASQIKTSTVTTGKKIEILNNQILRHASPSQQKTMTFVNLADAKPLQGTRLSIPISSASGVKSGQQIVIKTANLKQFTIPGKQFGNLTVKKLNVIPSSAVTTTTTTVNTPSTVTKSKIVFKPATNS